LLDLWFKARGQISALSRSGVALAEIYETDIEASTPRLTNLSVRGPVGPGDGLLAAGFVIGGPGKTTVLVRAIGPTLAKPPLMCRGRWPPLRSRSLTRREILPRVT
jgi:hypothetical protein